MNESDVYRLLQDLGGVEDEWFTLQQAAEPGRFSVEDAEGRAAEITVASFWVEVQATRPVERLLAGVTTAPSTAASLLRIAPDAGDPSRLHIRGRVYLDGFSLHALLLTVRDVLALAGPAPVAAAPAGVEATPEAADDAARAPVPFAFSSRDLDEAPEAGVAVTDDAAPAPITTSITSMPVEEAAAPVSAAYLPADAHEGEASPDELPEESIEQTPLSPRTPTTLEERLSVADSSPSEPAAASPPPLGATVRLSMPPPAERIAPAAPEASSATPAEALHPCPRCGADVQAGERFCMTCGAPQSGEGAGGPAESTAAGPSGGVAATIAWRRPAADGGEVAGDVACATCGANNPPGSRHCQTCGAVLSGATSSDAQSASRLTACARCGYSNPAGNRFCQGCGAPLTA